MHGELDCPDCENTRHSLEQEYISKLLKENRLMKEEIVKLYSFIKTLEQDRKQIARELVKVVVKQEQNQ